MRVGVVVFPGSNCDHDVLHVMGQVLHYETRALWHLDTNLNGIDAIIIPGGFSYGDYLRTGALAALSPIMQEIKRFAAAGGPVIGICNGFQILCESGLLPGALLKNVSMRFLSRLVHMKVEQTDTPFTSRCVKQETIDCPIAHFEGNYFIDQKGLRELEYNARVVFRYSDKDGVVDQNSRDSNPNGSLHSIAGICNPARNVIGLMPHPERSVESLIGAEGNDTGLKLFRLSTTSR